MALDTRGLASGFGQGFGLADRYYAGQKHQELAEEQSERADKRLGMETDRHNAQMDAYAQRDEQAGRQNDMEQIKVTLGKAAQGLDVSPEEIETLRKYPHIWQKAFSPETDQSIEIAQRLVDPEDPADMNDPETLAAINQFFAPEINKGAGKEKRIVGMYPGPDGESVTFDLEVVGDDGKPYKAPMTANRGKAGEDDEVMQVPVEKLIEQVQGARMLRNAFRTPQAQEQAAKMLAILTGKQEKGSYGDPYTEHGLVLQRGPDGKVNRVGDVKSDGNGGGAAAPADYRLAKLIQEEYAADGKELTFEQAWDKVKLAASDPARYVSDYVKSAVESGQNVDEDGQDLSREQLERQALESYQRIRRMIQDDRQQGGAPAASSEEAQKVLDQLAGSRGNSVPIPERQRRQAPPSAIEYLRQNPNTKDAFQAKYGYLPEDL